MSGDNVPQGQDPPSSGGAHTPTIEDEEESASTALPPPNEPDDELRRLEKEEEELKRKIAVKAAKKRIAELKRSNEEDSLEPSGSSEDEARHSGKRARQPRVQAAPPYFDTSLRNHAEFIYKCEVAFRTAPLTYRTQKSRILYGI
jgi:hypothetical protein